MKITFSSTVSSFYKIPPSFVDAASHRFPPNPSSSAPFAPSPPFSKLHHTPSLISPTLRHTLPNLSLSVSMPMNFATFSTLFSVAAR
ncbi:hypothetical protein AHAS_Ahas20G0178000 [Arachis hypogaea]